MINERRSSSKAALWRRLRASEVRKSLTEKNNGEKKLRRSMSMTKLQDIIPVEISDSHAFEVPRQGANAFQRKVSCLAKLNVSHDETMEIERKISEARNIMRKSRNTDQQDGVTVNSKLRDGGKHVTISELANDGVETDTKIKEAMDYVDDSTKINKKDKGKKKSKIKSKNQRKRRRKSTIKNPDFLEDFQAKRKANKNDSKDQKDDMGANDRLALPLIDMKKRLSVVKTLNMLANQKQEETINSLLVKRIQAQARVREKYKPYYNDVIQTRNKRPPRKLQALNASVVASGNSSDNEANRQPLLDDRFVALMRSLNTKKDFKTFSVNANTHSSIDS